MHDVVVIGGGIAGLSAAWALRNRDVVVLEASDRVGRRIRSERRGRYWLNYGAHVFAGPGTPTDRLLRETGVEAVDVPGVLTGVSLEGRLVAGGRIETYPLRLPLSARDRLAFARTGIRLRLGVARYDRILRSGNQERVLAYLGDRTFADWLGPVPPAVDAVLRPTIQRSSGEPEELAAGYGIGYFHLVWDRSDQLATLYPSKTPAQLWAMEGNTILPGIDDYPRKTEVTYLADAQKLLDFARANGIGTLSAWAIQRDNGGCPGSTDSNSCSGIVQNAWDFSHLLEPFTGP